MKRRETKSWQENAGRSALVRAGSRWLSFARSLSRGPRRMVAADTLAFIESLYGGRFKSVEGGAFSLDKVYRMKSGGLFVSETRLSLSVHPRFDLRLLNITYGHAGSQMFRETTTTAHTLLTHAGVSGRVQPLAARHGSHAGAAATSPTVHTWNVLQSSAGRHLSAFSYVNIHVQRAQQAQGLESARHNARVERLPSGEAASSRSGETSRATMAPVSIHTRQTSHHLRPFVVQALRQEFVSLLLNTYLPTTIVSRESLLVRTTADLLRAPQRQATAQGEAFSRFAPGVMERRPAPWTYAEPAPRHTTSGTFERRRELSSSGTIREHAAAGNPQPPLLHVLPPAALLLSLSEHSTPMLARDAGGAGQTINYLSGHAPAPSLQRLYTRTTSQVTREGSAAARAPRVFAQTPRQQTPHLPTSAREVFSSMHTFVERAHSTVVDINHVNYPTVFTSPGFEPMQRRGFEQVSARPRRASSVATPGDATSRGLLGRSVEFVRLASVAMFTREVSTHDTRTQGRPDQTPGVFATQGAPGAGTFLFATGLLRRSGGASTAGALSPTSAVALRLGAADTQRTERETRAARPEGMALELIRHRREEVLQLPKPGYVFTQPARAQLEERQVITKASREEIVEVVRKEVRSLTASTHAVPTSSRADLAGIADEVYSKLARRLLVEKERLGRF